MAPLIWITDGTQNKRVSKETDIPEGWRETSQSLTIRMKTKLLALAFAVILTSSSLVGCEQQGKGEPIHPEFDRSEQIIRMKVVFHDSLSGVRKAKEVATGKPAEEGLLGFAGWNNQNTYCEVHAVRPNNSLDDRVLTIGHEVLHCVYGRYHKE